MTKVKLKDATRELLKGAEETLSKLSGMRKNADALAQLAKKQENQFAREEERRRAEEKQAEQERLISQHAKAFTMPDTDDEPKPVQTAPAPKAEEKPATEKAPVKAEAPAKPAAPVKAEASETKKEASPAPKAEEKTVPAAAPKAKEEKKEPAPAPVKQEEKQPVQKLEESFSSSRSSSEG